MKILPLTKFFFRETVKERFFWGVVVFDLLFCFFAYYLSEITAGDNVKIAMDFILSFQFFIVAIFSVLVSWNAIQSDLNNKVIYLIYSKPVTKRDYLAAKSLSLYLALVVLVFILTVLNSSAFFVINRISKLYVPHVIVIHRLAVFGVSLVFMGMMLVSLSLMFSVSFSSNIVSLFVSFIVFIIGLELSPVKELVVSSELASEINKIVVRTAYYVFPNFSLFDVKPYVVHKSVNMPFAYVAGIFVYSLIWSFIFLLLTYMIFRNKEF